MLTGKLVPHTNTLTNKKNKKKPEDKTPRESNILPLGANPAQNHFYSADLRDSHWRETRNTSVQQLTRPVGHTHAHKKRD